MIIFLTILPFWFLIGFAYGFAYYYKNHENIYTTLKLDKGDHIMAFLVAFMFGFIGIFGSKFFYNELSRKDINKIKQLDTSKASFVQTGEIIYLNYENKIYLKNTNYDCVNEVNWYDTSTGYEVPDLSPSLNKLLQALKIKEKYEREILKGI